MVYLDGTLGLLERAVGRLGADHGAHQLVRATVDHPLPVVHDGPHEPVGPGHEPVLEEYGHVVPVDDARADLVPPERAHELAVPHAVGYGEYEAAAAPELAPQPGAQQELDAGQVDLAQIPRVVHVRQVHVQVGGQAHGRVHRRVGGPQLFLQARGRHVAEQRPEKVRHVHRAHGQHDERQHGARRGQHRHRRGVAAAGRGGRPRRVCRRRGRRRYGHRRVPDGTVGGGARRNGHETIDTNRHCARAILKRHTWHADPRFRSQSPPKTRVCRKRRRRRRARVLKRFDYVKNKKKNAII